MSKINEIHKHTCTRTQTLIYIQKKRQYSWFLIFLINSVVATTTTTTKTTIMNHVQCSMNFNLKKFSSCNTTIIIINKSYFIPFHSIPFKFFFFCIHIQFMKIFFFFPSLALDRVLLSVIKINGYIRIYKLLWIIIWNQHSSWMAIIDLSSFVKEE